jgi:ATP-dependent helicase HrpA
MTDLAELESRISRAMLADRYRLRRQLGTICGLREAGKAGEKELRRLLDELSRSLDRRRQREAGVPAVRFEEELPILQKRDEIAEAIRSHQVVVVSGETGSGKSTQLPKICLEIGRGVAGMIGHTQPRRIAARSIATRLAHELRCPLGREVGFKIRFTDVTSAQTYVKLMTDGMLLAETQGDRFLNQYDTIILDEAHERSLNVDFLIGYLKRLLAKRRELKLVITSATIDSVRFSRHFRTSRGPAPVVEVSGRNFPVDIFYRPIEPDDDGDDDADGDEPDLERAVLDAVDELTSIDRGGDVLVFMPTERHIHDTAKALRGRLLKGDRRGRPVEILPLYARLPAKQQQRVFEPHRHRRIVIATNVAESSLTVPGIRYVIDPGTARISRYSPRSKTQRLPIEAISQASADQRAGRCGRIGPGVCIRLYGEGDYDARDRFTPPEILRSNLAAVILQLTALRLGSVDKFPFLDAPRPAAIRDGYRTLVELQALDGKHRLTEIGRRLARMPVDPRIGRMILAADEAGCLAEVLVIASALEVRDPRERPLEKQEAADTCHARFAEGESDFFGHLKLWDFYHHLKAKLSRSQLRKACRQNFLSYNRMREWLDVHRQLLQLADEAGLKPSRRRDDYEAVHRAVLTGLLSSVAQRTGTYEYTVAGGTTAYLWPGSALFEARPGWVMAAEVVETTKRYLRNCARIDPRWIEPAAEHLVKRSYSEPHWDRASGSTVAFEKVTLFGLTVVPRRRVAYGPVNPAHARELFIQHALVEGQLDTSAAFLRHNQELLDAMERLQAKLRRNDLVLGEWSRYEFYDERIPDDVYDAARLNAWLKQAEHEDAGVLCMSQGDVIRDPVDEATTREFPDSLRLGQDELALEYRYEPGSDEDGVTLHVPVDAAGRLEAGDLDWLVPGLLEPKIVALIKSLPKPVRRKLVPAADTAREVLPEIRFGQGCLLERVAAVLSRIAGERITARSFQQDKLPDELRMNVRVEGTGGQTLAQGRDLRAVHRELGATISARFDQLDDPQWTRDGLVAWDFDELPEAVEISRGGVVLKGFPALLDRGESVSRRLVESPERAREENRNGLRRLCFLAARRDLQRQVQWLPGLEKMSLYAASIPGFAVERQLAELIADRAFVADQPVPRTKAAFEKALAEGRKRIVPAVQDVTKLAGPLFEEHHGARLAVQQATAAIFQYAVADAEAQLDALVGPHFLTATPWTWLRHFPRYFRAVRLRFDKLRGGSLARDQRSCEEITARLEACRERAEEHRQAGLHDPELVGYRWMVEEYRVSLFAQELGTSVPVSAKRLERQWAKIRE